MQRDAAKKAGQPRQVCATCSHTMLGVLYFPLSEPFVAKVPHVTYGCNLRENVLTEEAAAARDMAVLQRSYCP